MKVAYLYNRPKSVADEWEAEKVFIDVKGTSRMERSDMLEHGGVRAGDTLMLAALSDLGKGAAAKAIADKIRRLGVAIEVKPLTPAKAKKKPGRAPHLKPTDEQQKQICGLWRSGLEQGHVLNRAAQIMEVDAVTRNQMNRLCGPRFKDKEQSE